MAPGPGPTDLQPASLAEDAAEIWAAAAPGPIRLARTSAMPKRRAADSGHFVAGVEFMSFLLTRGRRKRAAEAVSARFRGRFKRRGRGICADEEQYSAESVAPGESPESTVLVPRVTGLLVAWGAGDQSAFEKLVPLVHAELRRLAHREMARERGGHTLQTTALVNE